MPKAGLRSDVIGLLGAVTLGVVMLSPAMTLYGVFGPTFLFAGRAAPLAFVWALMATLPTAISYAILSRERPNSGSAASWFTEATSRRLGVWAGWMVFAYYFTNFIIQPVTFGVFLNDLFQSFGLPVNLGTFLIGIFLCCVWPGWIVYRGVSVSVKGALLFLLFESTIVLTLCATVALRSPDHLSFAGFYLSSSPSGTSGIFRAMVFGILAYCGFDVVSTLAEETRMAKRLIPQATLLSLFLYALIIIFGIWCLSFGSTAEHLKKIAETGAMPISEIARMYWGKASVLVSITAISASLGLAIATSVGASRILFSMSRESLVPEWFGQLHPRFIVPWQALHLIFVLGFCASVVVAIVVGPYNSYVWWGTTSTFFAMLTYLMVNASVVILNRKFVFGSPLNFVLFGFVPVTGFLADLYILIRSFFIELLQQDWMTGKSVVVFDVACAIAAGIAALRFRR